MASLLSHPAAAVGLFPWIKFPQWRRRIFLLGMVCTLIPDADVIGYRLGVRYESLFGHRGFSHSIAFAALWTCLLSLTFIRKASSLLRSQVVAFFFLATLSHALIDGLTNGGLGVALFAPFSNQRYFLPWRPILVSPLRLSRFFSQRGWQVLQSELLWLWLPCLLLALVGWLLRSRSQRS